MGKTQQDVADAIGMESYGNYERGKEQLPFWRILQLREYYRANINEMIEGCSVAFIPQWDSDHDDEYHALIEKLREKCIKLSKRKLLILIVIANELSKGDT